MEVVGILVFIARTLTSDRFFGAFLSALISAIILSVRVALIVGSREKVSESLDALMQPPAIANHGRQRHGETRSKPKASKVATVACPLGYVFRSKGKGCL